MKALCWYGEGDVRVEDVADPTIDDARDVIVKITSTAICGSDLHLYHGLMPTMEKGDVLGHEPMGEVVEVGSAVTKLKVGDRVLVPFTINLDLEQIERSICDKPLPSAAIVAAAGFILGGGMATRPAVVLLALFGRKAAKETATNFMTGMVRARTR